AVVGRDDVTFEPDRHVAFHPGQCARVLVGGKPAGWIGALNPALLQKYDLPDAAVGFELDVRAIQARPLPVHRPLPRLQPVRRDLALVVDETLPAAQLQAEIAAAGKPLVVDVTLFDVYAGEGVPKGRKSLAFRVLLQDTDKTLTDAEVEAQVRQVVKVL